MADSPDDDASDRPDEGADRPAGAPSFEEVDAQIDKARRALADIEGTGDGERFMAEGAPAENDDVTDDTIAPPG